MGRALLLAEKPSLMNEIKSVYRTMGFKDTIDFIAFAGHTMRACAPGAYNDLWAEKKWSWEQLPMLPDKFKFEVAPDKQEIYNRVKEHLDKNNYDYVINACDPDREGQAIFQYVYDALNCKLPIKRFWTNDLTEPAIKNALLNLRYAGDGKTPNLANLTKASMLRAEFDWKVGMNLSRAASLAMRGLCKIGRVKTPTLKMIVDREIAIRDFVPKSSYGITATFNNGSFEGNLVEREVNEEDGKKSEKWPAVLYETEAEAKAKIKTLPKTVSVYDYKKEIETTNPYTLFSLSDLQAKASSMFGYGVDETLAIVQKLYDNKILSYPRTDNTCIASNLVEKFDEMLVAAACVPAVEKYAKQYKGDTANYQRIKKNKRYVDDKKMAEKGHYAIVPTGKTFNFASLSKQEQDILTLVCKRFVGIFMDPMKSEKTTIITTSKEGEEIWFRSSGKKLMSLGFMVLYERESEDTLLPALNKGDSVAITGLKTYESKKTKPSRFTDGSLVDAMKNPAKLLEDSSLKEILTKKEGIGTEATRAAIIKGLVDDGYVVAKASKGKAKQLHATDMGIALIQNLGNRSITSVDLTGTWEKNLFDIETGTKNPEECITEMNEYVIQAIEDLKGGQFMNVGQKGKSNSKVVVGKCPKCGADAIESENYLYCSKYSKEAKPGSCNFIVGKTILGGKLKSSDIKKMINLETTSPIKMKSKEGKTFEAGLRWNTETNKVEFVFANTMAQSAPAVSKCALCDGNIIEAKGKFGPYFKCTSNCGVQFSKAVAGHNLTKTEVKKLMSEQVVGPFELKKKDGGTFNASLKFDKNTKKIVFEFNK